MLSGGRSASANGKKERNSLGLTLR